MTCSAAMRRTGPFGVWQIMMWLEMGECSRSAWRVIEIAFATYDVFPASMARLLEEGSHVNTSGVSDSWKRAFTYFKASTVCLELIVTLPCSSCSDPPKDQRMARMAMLVSSSCASPNPQG